MEGDTPSFLNLIRNGLSDPEHPEWAVGEVAMSCTRLAFNVGTSNLRLVRSILTQMMKCWDGRQVAYG